MPNIGPIRFIGTDAKGRYVLRAPHDCGDVVSWVIVQARPEKGRYRYVVAPISKAGYATFEIIEQALHTLEHLVEHPEIERI